MRNFKGYKYIAEREVNAAFMQLEMASTNYENFEAEENLKYRKFIYTMINHLDSLIERAYLDD